MAVDTGVYDDRPAEVTVEHSPEQTLVAVETEHGSAVAAVDVGHLPLAASLELARDIRAAGVRGRSGRSSRTGGSPPEDRMGRGPAVDIRLEMGPDILGGTGEATRPAAAKQHEHQTGQSCITPTARQAWSLSAV